MSGWPPDGPNGLEECCVGWHVPPTSTYMMKYLHVGPVVKRRIAQKQIIRYLEYQRKLVI